MSVPRRLSGGQGVAEWVGPRRREKKPVGFLMPAPRPPPPSRAAILIRPFGRTRRKSSAPSCASASKSTPAESSTRSLGLAWPASPSGTRRLRMPLSRRGLRNFRIRVGSREDASALRSVVARRSGVVGEQAIPWYFEICAINEVQGITEVRRRLRSAMASFVSSRHAGGTEVRPTPTPHLTTTLRVDGRSLRVGEPMNGGRRFRGQRCDTSGALRGRGRGCSRSGRFAFCALSFLFVRRQTCTGVIGFGGCTLQARWGVPTPTVG